MSDQFLLQYNVNKTQRKSKTKWPYNIEVVQVAIDK